MMTFAIFLSFLIAFCPKKILHQPATVFRARAGYDFHMVVKPIILRDVIQRTGRSPFGISRTKNNP
jgi:hypothetical protein